MATIDLKAVKKSYGNEQVVHGIDAHIADGEFAVLVGPSGCGKSTLLRMVAGLESISDGTISIGSTVVNDLLPKERDIAMVFQNYALYPHMSVAENMGFSLRLQKSPKAEMDRRVGEAAAILGLEELLERFPRQLSGGQRQRVAMGRAIVRDPAVFLFDEPLSNLDAKLRVQMRTELKALHQKLGSTIVYVTHDQIEAMTMADKIFVLKDGQLAQVGTPLELYDHPSDSFVATFIGSPSMNLIEAEVIDTHLVRFVDGQQLMLVSSQPVGTRLMVGIRPEHLCVATEGPKLDVKVDVVEPTGAETLVTCTGPSGALIAALRDRVALEVGGILSLKIPTDRCHLFDINTGKALVKS